MKIIWHYITSYSNNIKQCQIVWVISMTEVIVIFHKQYKKGVFRRHVISDAKITNEHVCLTNYSDKGEVIYNNCIPLTDLDDIVTLNNHRVGSGYNHGDIRELLQRPVTITECLTGNHTIWLIFIKHGVPIITFRDIKSAKAYVKMAKVAMYSLNLGDK